MIKNLVLSAFFTVGIISSGAAAQPSNKESHAYKEIHTEELKSWVDQDKKMVLVDARSVEYFDGTLIANAIWLPYNTSEKNLNKALPSKNALIVVYCCSPECPASQSMAERLIASGYTNVYKYPEGLQGWVKKGLPIN